MGFAPYAIEIERKPAHWENYKPVLHRTRAQFTNTTVEAGKARLSHITRRRADTKRNTKYLSMEYVLIHFY